MGIKSRKKAILAFAVVAMIAAVATSMATYSAFAVADTEIQTKNVTLKAKGWAFQRIDTETIKQQNVTLELTIELGQRKGTIILIANGSGSVDVNGTIYTIQSGKGFILTGRRIALARFVGVDAQNNEISLGIQTVYFWWGGKLFAFRSRAVLRTVENPMLLLLRGAARVQ